ncbi:hypothetical protein MTR67_011631 [Solanum verrucosum]|uniref:Glycine-rich protein n=1 Tax=Solanum verrucosum TaxID=315347 RepID=A0AAF0TGA3_SOLVR|nr:hypothetical protein MTR67_011631 [Solanum verrucosum]
MMGSKAFFVSWHFLVIFAIISSEVVARELAETSMKSDVVYENGYNDIDGYSRDEHDAYNNGYKYFGGGYYPPRGGNNFSGRSVWPFLLRTRSGFADLSHCKKKKVQKNSKRSTPQKDSKYEKSPLDSRRRK